MPRSGAASIVGSRSAGAGAEPSSWPVGLTGRRHAAALARDVVVPRDEAASPPGEGNRLSMWRSRASNPAGKALEPMLGEPADEDRAPALAGQIPVMAEEI